MNAGILADGFGASTSEETKSAKKLSVIMSVYEKENPIYFDKCMHSIWTKQILKPDQIVLIKDGPLNCNLENVLDKWISIIPDILLVIKLNENHGLAKALNLALEAATGDYIARMDTDDISTPYRFMKQVNFLNINNSVDVVGGQISEIDENDKIIKDIVKYPESHDELLLFFKKRDPLAHPSAMFRKSFFDKAGTYNESCRLCEDTYLWFMGFKSGCKFSNLDFICLNYRRSENFYYRRGDLKKAIFLLKKRLFVINRQLNFGVLSDIYALSYFLMSISPMKIKKALYNFFR